MRSEETNQIQALAGWLCKRSRPRSVDGARIDGIEEDADGPDPRCRRAQCRAASRRRPARRRRGTLNPRWDAPPRSIRNDRLLMIPSGDYLADPVGRRRGQNGKVPVPVPRRQAREPHAYATGVRAGAASHAGPAARATTSPLPSAASNPVGGTLWNPAADRSSATAANS
jgi:hypothetical protein